jgi:ferritin-like metal-binding protein YciE
MALDSLKDVFSEQINDLRSAEEQLIAALPALEQAASSDELRQAFGEHLAETKQHLERLDDVIAGAGMERSGKTCEGMAGLIREGSEIASASGDPMAKDAALIAAAQRVEHYEIAGYGTVVALAGHLGLDDAKDVLDQTLDEEAAADKLLTKIATGGMFKSGVNEAAAR